MQRSYTVFWRKWDQKFPKDSITPARHTQSLLFVTNHLAPCPNQPAYLFNSRPAKTYFDFIRDILCSNTEPFNCNMVYVVGRAAYRGVICTRSSTCQLRDLLLPKIESWINKILGTFCCAPLHQQPRTRRS
jgi:hypothetical protein